MNPGDLVNVAGWRGWVQSIWTDGTVVALRLDIPPNDQLVGYRCLRVADIERSKAKAQADWLAHIGFAPRVAAQIARPAL